MSLKTMWPLNKQVFGKNTSIKTVAVTLCVLLFTSFLPLLSNHASAENNAKQILYINAFHRGYGWSDEVEKGLRDTLDEAAGNIELSVVYLDTLRFGSNTISTKIAELLTLKRVSDQTSMVITSDNAALNFTLSHQNQLFPTQPIIYTALKDYPASALQNTQFVTGISEYTDYQNAIDLALSIHPGTTSLVFIGTTKENHNKHIVDVVKTDVMPKYNTTYDVELITDKPVDELDAALAQFPANTLIFALSNTLPKSDGSMYSPAETARLLASITPFPVYTYWHSHIGHGAVGGQIVTGYSQGKAAAQLALQILSQSADEPLPPPQSAPSSLFFDLEAVAKYGIDETLIPEGTRFINFQPPIWQEYKNEVLITLVVIFGLISLVLAFVLLTKRQSETIEQINDENVELTHALDINQEALEDITHQFEEVNPIDELTGLSNFRHFNEMLDKELRRASRYKTPLSLLLISIDSFEEYKRTSGEEKAYELMADVGKVISQTCQRSSDVLAHLLEEKFAIILPHTTRENSLIVCQKLHANLAEKHYPFVLSTTGTVTLSIGLSSLESTADRINPQHMFNTSEMMRIDAERKGGNATSTDIINTQSTQSAFRNE